MSPRQQKRVTARRWQTASTASSAWRFEWMSLRMASIYVWGRPRAGSTPPVGRGMSLVRQPVAQVFLCERRGLVDDQQVLRVALLGGFREVKRAGNHRVTIENHQL